MSEQAGVKKSPVGRVATALVVLALLGTGAWVVWERTSGRETTDDAQVEGHVHSISPAVSGGVIRSHVENNQVVKAGDPLFELDQKSYIVALNRAKAELAEAEAENSASAADVPVVSTTTTTRLSAAEAELVQIHAAEAVALKEVETARARKASAQPLVAAAKADADRAAADLNRMKALLAKDEVSKQQYDGAFAAAESARARLEGAQAKVAEADQEITLAESRVQRERSRMPRAQAEIEGAKSGPQEVAARKARVVSTGTRIVTKRAALAGAELDMERTIVRAPVSGIIGQKNFEVGQIIAAGTPVVAIVDAENLWVVANYKENQLQRLQAGQAAEVEIDALGGAKLKGKVESTAAATGARFSLLPPENASGNFVKVVQRVPVKIVLDAGQAEVKRLRPGMSAYATVQVVKER